MSEYIPSNVTAEDFFVYFCKDENAKEFYEQVVEEKIKQEEENVHLKRDMELIEEQLYFAKQLIGDLEYLLKHETRLTEVKKKFRDCLEQSSLER